MRQRFGAIKKRLRDRRPSELDALIAERASRRSAASSNASPEPGRAGGGDSAQAAAHKTRAGMQSGRGAAAKCASGRMSRRGAAAAPVVTERTAVARQWSAETLKRAIEAGFAPASHRGFHLPHVHLPHLHAPHLNVPHVGHQKKQEPAAAGVGATSAQDKPSEQGHLPHVHLPHLHAPHLHAPHLHAPHMHAPHFGHHKKKGTDGGAPEDAAQSHRTALASSVSASVINAAMADSSGALSC